MTSRAAANGDPFKRLLEKLDHPLVFSFYLKGIEEPSCGNAFDVVACKIELQVLKHRIAAMNDLDCVDTKQNARETGTAFLRHKFLTWLTFPINNLPLETLSAIFRMVLEASQSTDVGRFQLTQICRRWRTVAINDKLLWNVVEIYDGPDFLRSRTWLERAGQASLYITIRDKAMVGEWGVMRPRYPTKEVGILMDIILSKAATIHTLCIVLRRSALLSALERLSGPEMLSSLKCLSLTGLGPSPARYLHAPWNIVAPQLRTVYVHSMAIDWNPSLLSNITTLRLQQIPLEVIPPFPRLPEILRNCSMLHGLVCVGAAGRVDLTSGSSSWQSVNLPYLGRLSIRDCSPYYARAIVTSISATNLVSLDIGDLISASCWSLFQTLIGRFPLLRNLSLRDLDPTSSEADGFLDIFVQFLRSVPSITFLTLSHTPPLMLEAFLLDPRYHCNKYLPAESERPVVLCPSLRVLVVDEENDRTLKFVAQRLNLGIPIKCITRDKIGSSSLLT